MKRKATQQSFAARPHPRSLFIDDSEDSKQAVTLLKHNGFTFSLHKIRSDDPEFTSYELPLLITGTGDSQGLAGVERYVHSSIALGEVC